MFNIKNSLVRLSASLSLAFAGVLPVVCVYAADTPSTAAPTVSERLDDSRAHINAKRWSSARAGLLIAAREEPNNADVHNLLGYVYRKQSSPDLTKAFEHYKRALQLDPKHKGAHEYIGEAYLMDKKPQEAVKHLAELETICGNRRCEEYKDLEAALANYTSTK